MASIRENLNYDPAELKFGTSGLRALVTDMTDLECYINVVGFLRFLNMKPKTTVFLAGDLRESTPRIMRAVARAIEDEGGVVRYCGLIPTPTLAYYAYDEDKPSIMVTGSHIPANRNGIKFNKPHGEVLKEDETGVKQAVAAVRVEIYARPAEESQWDESGWLKTAAELPAEEPEARKHYMERFTSVFDRQTLAGKKVVVYQHSAVGRDMLMELFKDLGAETVAVGRSEVFVPIDSENVTPKDQAYFRQVAAEHPDAFAIVSTDGDSDRPFVIDEHGVFHRGDVLGVVVAQWLGADFAAFPVSSSDAADSWLSQQGVAWSHTRIGSPYVISAMEKAKAEGKRQVVGWEVNGGFLTGSELTVNGQPLKALPTRDAALPIIVALVAALQEGKTVSEMFASLPQRFTQAGLINDFPVEASKAIIAKFSADNEATRRELGAYFTSEHGFDAITSINSLDGVRIYFENGDIAHLRPSGNAPQLRMYGVAASQERADEIVALALAEPDGIFRRMQADTRL